MPPPSRVLPRSVWIPSLAHQAAHDPPKRFCVTGERLSDQLSRRGVGRKKRRRAFLENINVK